MKSSDEIYMLHDDTDIHAFNQLTLEQRQEYDNLPEIFSKEELTEILISSII